MPAATTSGIVDLRVKAREAVSRCRKLATFSEEPGRTTRTFLSAPMRDCHGEITSWLKHMNADIHIDAVGNFHALYPGSQPNAPRLLIGSHLDTVPNAGAFDGILGVVLGVALIELVSGEQFPFCVELIGFSEEEGVRFNTPFIGSRALIGRVDNELLEKKDGSGITLREAIAGFGLNPDQIPSARISENAFGYLEFHIEQGPLLEHLGLPLGIVEAISGQSKLELTFIGRANHAGTTPMDLRRDALAAAAEWIVAVEREAIKTPGLTATVGSVHADPGVTNVIAGNARVTLDIRHRDDAVRNTALEQLLHLAQTIATRRELSLREGGMSCQPAVPMDTILTRHVEEAVRAAGCQPYRVASGAGHDAMILAGRIPAAMIFLRTPGGISHSPEEDVRIEDVEMALKAGVNFLRLLASSDLDALRRTQRA